MLFTKAPKGIKTYACYKKNCGDCNGRLLVGTGAYSGSPGATLLRDLGFCDCECHLPVKQRPGAGIELLESIPDVRETVG
jgi:hypothetical protein